ncbi:uncharacterized protein [Nicotiana sylvestris]|uniref:uncharacterized protein n=1 Tax=Nicotiana sylvestris TaxID=4096 RepID=UPI00388C7717
MGLSITNENTAAGSSGILTLLDMPTSPVIEEYENIIITDSTPSSIEVGQVYQDKETIATAMKHYSIMHKFQFRVKDLVLEVFLVIMFSRIVVIFYWLICVGENCTWHFKATSINDSAMFNVRNFDKQHTCSLMDNTFIQRKPTAMIVGSMIIPKYSDPKTIYIPKDIQFDMLSEHDVNLTYMQVWRAKEKTLQFLRGHPADSYNKLPSYLYIIEKTYPGPVVVVDGTFLKSAYRGIMLTTSTMDAAGIILPLAYVVVDSENDASWKWFFEQFKLAYGERANMCVVSDRNESILKATSIVYPGMSHYSCMWHIWTNIRAKFKKGHLKLSELYFTTARSYTLDEFNEKMSKIEEIDPRVKAYLYDIGYYRWSRVHAMVNRAWNMTSNIAESLNAVRASTDYIHTVIDGVRRYIVCLENKKCSCGQFQLDELPCPHALAALRQRDESFEEYCSPYYTRANLLRTYEIPVNLLSDESKWNVPQHITEEVVNLPKGEKRQPGRPQKERYKTYDEINSKKYKVSCGNCGGEGHNKRSYKNAPKMK